MPTENEDVSAADRILSLVHTGAEAESRLLKKERKAERRLAAAIAALADDERRLRRAQERVAVSSAAVAEAQARLRAAQVQRAAGPPTDHA